MRILFDLLAVLADDFVLDFKSIDEVLLDDAELQPWLVLQDFKDEQWTEHLVLLILILLFVLFVAHHSECSFEVDLILRSRQIPEICQSLDPKLTCCGWI